MPLVPDDFNWQWIFDTNIAWPMAHMLNPFMLEILLQKTGFTLFMILFFESIEVFVITAFQGQYLIFVGDDASLEHIGDTLMGDFLQGVLGILLARVVILTWKVPPWSPSPVGKYRKLFFKRVLQYIFWVVSLSVTNSKIIIPNSYSINYGVFIVTITTTIFIYTWYKTNNSPLERSLYWYNYSKNEYETVFLGILINALLLLVCTFVHVWYSYFQSWIVWIVAITFNVFILITNDRLWELPYSMSCGLIRQRLNAVNDSSYNSHYDSNYDITPTNDHITVSTTNNTNFNIPTTM